MGLQDFITKAGELLPQAVQRQVANSWACPAYTVRLGMWCIRADAAVLTEAPTTILQRLLSSFVRSRLRHAASATTTLPASLVST